MIELIDEKELPARFKYPKEFLWVLDIPLSNLKPWIFHSGEGLKSRYEGIKKRYPDRLLIPFAFRQDCDEVACWDLNDNNKIKVIEDYTRANPFEDVEYNTFLDWLKQAVEDMIEFCIRDTLDN
jgi:hypothetical protein